MADTWAKLGETEKKPYLEAAEIDKERYNKEVKEFNSQQKNKEKKVEANGNAASNSSISSAAPPIVNSSEKKTFNSDIPIFSEEFLEHNKTVEAELKVLRKVSTFHDMYIFSQLNFVY